MNRFSRLGLLASATLLFGSTPWLAADEQPGELWETTSQPEMEGMPMKMPVQTVRQCLAKGWSHAPPGADPSCATTNFERTGNRATWMIQCTGQMAMSGMGEISFEGTDAFSGAIKMSGQGVSMTVKLSGKKIGDCDQPQ